MVIIMRENVIVSITGRHMADEEENTIQTEQPGKYAFFQGKHIIRYEEYMESGSDTPVSIPCMLKIDRENVILSKKGAAPMKMHFSPGTAHDTLYQTPLGPLPISVRTSHLEINECEEKITVDLTYRLHMNGDPVSDCRMTISIRGSK